MKRENATTKHWVFSQGFYFISYITEIMVNHFVNQLTFFLQKDFSFFTMVKSFA